MKKFLLIILLFTVFFTACEPNETYEYNKRILDTYATNTDYAFITQTGYESAQKNVNFKNIITNKIALDGKPVELFYGTRYQQTLVNDCLYFCYEYKRENEIGHHALGYVDINTLKVCVDYFDYERYSFDYNFSTSEFVCFTFKKDLNDLNTINIVFFKDRNKLIFDYDLSKLNYDIKDVEEPLESGKGWDDERANKYGRPLEVKCWAFAVGNISLNPFKIKKCKEALDYIQRQDGFLGFHPEPPKGTICIFDSENNAKGARNMCRSMGITCGKSIEECFVDVRYLRHAKNK